MNQWPGVKLRVTEGWDEEGHHAADSLHYEGRAVDVTTSDRDRSKYGMLAKLAVEAGFDWVYYESRAHIHCSVKSESSQAVKSGGCFPGIAKVRTRTGVKPLSSLMIGDEVQVMDPRTGELKFSEVILFLDKSPNHFKYYLKIETSSGKTLQVTPSHLVVAVKEKSDMSAHRTGNELGEESENELETMFASEIEIGDTLYTVDGGKRFVDRVVNVTNSRHEGVYAPLTVEGTIVVDDVVTSCYAVINSHSLAHLAYGPLRLYHNLQLSFRRLWESTFKPLSILRSGPVKTSTTPAVATAAAQEQNGIHWYANVLFSIAEYVLPSHMMYGS
ncbi:hypothetical protein RUM44_006138 [Polyplax serrata]|uniref:Protein hedgehog n=1 Tax=Polyplax serrata TaxID=468196 RepID=A0ABR1AZ40_POLSC